MKINDFIEDIKLNCENITYLCTAHILNKIYDVENDEVHIKELKDLFQDYNALLRYLNDYAGKIYRHNNYSINQYYLDICNHMKIDSDNELLFNYLYSKISDYVEDDIRKIDNEDIQEQLLKNIQSVYAEIENLKYYQDNKEVLCVKLVHIEKLLNLFDF